MRESLLETLTQMLDNDKLSVNSTISCALFDDDSCSASDSKDEFVLVYNVVQHLTREASYLFHMKTCYVSKLDYLSCFFSSAKEPVF